MSDGTGTTDDQAAVIAFLRDPANHADATAIEEIVTHASHLFLADRHAVKMKRAVRYPFLDYSTVEKRRQACRREVSLNRRTAPGLYRGVEEIGGPESRLGWGQAPAREPVVMMNRFDQSALFDRRAEEGTLTAADLEGLADAVRRFHDSLPVIEPQPDWPGSFGWVIDDNRAELAELAEWRRDGLQRLDGWTEGRRADHADLLAGRSAAVRLCHGDLHLRNVVMLDGVPTPFDCIEFDDAIASIDPLYDIAFLMMDLLHRGRADLSSRFLSRYLFPETGAAWRDDPDLWRAQALVDLYLSQRACVRAKISLAGGLAAEPANRATADGYLDLALSLTDRRRPVLIAIGGLSGTGKTTLAHALLAEPALRGGVIHLRSDVIRKRLFGAGDSEALPARAYEPDVGRRVFGLMRELAGRCLDAGWSVLVDGVYARPSEREAIRAVAVERGQAFRPLWLDAGEAVRIARIDARRGDASDADAAVARRQSGYDLGPIDWPVLDVSQAFATVRRRAVEKLGF